MFQTYKIVLTIEVDNKTVNFKTWKWWFGTAIMY